MLSTESPPSPAQKPKRVAKSAARGVFLIGVALVAAIGAAFLLTRYMDSRVAAARVPTTRVVVARVDIPVATPIREEWLELVDWPAAARPEGTASDVQSLVAKVATTPIAKGEALLPQKLAAGGARSGLATLIPEGMRAEAVRVDDVVGVAGFIHPGDHVDVIVTMSPREGIPITSKIVLQNIRVLAVGKDLERRGKEAEKAVPVTVATLMVTVEEAERLAHATTGRILLALRGIGDSGAVSSNGITTAALMNSPPPEPVHVVAKPDKVRPKREVRQAVAEEPTREKKVVEILRGDLFEQRDFEALERRR